MFTNEKVLLDSKSIKEKIMVGNNRDKTIRQNVLIRSCIGIKKVWNNHLSQ